MARNHDFRAASAAREVITITIDDDRVYTFPGDVAADSWLSFLDQWASLLEGDSLPIKVIEPMYRTVMGDERFDELRKELSWAEMVFVANTLWTEYIGGRAANEGGDSDPK